MIGLASVEIPHYRPYFSATSPHKSRRRRFIVRPWSAEKGDVPVYELRGKVQVNFAPEDSITITNNSNADCWYAARSWFGTDPTDSDDWASTAWKFLWARARNIARARGLR